jgi:pyrroloquinoline quinone biosynthesis protein D
VVLYPEGMVRLNDSAAEILRRCDGATPLSAVIADLEQAFGAPDLADDVLELVAAACADGWLRRAAPAGG